MSIVPEGDEHYQIRVTRLSVQPPGEELWTEVSTDVEIVENGRKESVIVRQKSGHVDIKPQEIILNRSEWPSIRAAIDFMVEELRD